MPVNAVNTIPVPAPRTMTREDMTGMLNQITTQAAELQTALNGANDNSVLDSATSIGIQNAATSLNMVYDSYIART